ncbi:MAG: hypothetical protein A2X58_08495 [Nitrospirae bacterium GWC2_56_14]|nr:MAG: hypothetical protein A2X58_08495 [Nitrospirae bacterium GWC2_56_14]
MLVRSMEYDDKGLPVPGLRLGKRPSALGDHFTLVRLKGNEPAISYDIAVTKQKPDLVKPLDAVYKWTGKGFTFGVESRDEILKNGPGKVSDPKEFAAVVVWIIAGPVLGAAGGFVIGAGDAIRQGAMELSKVAINGEQVITCTTYEYDASERLSFMRMHTPDLKQELVRTEYSYEGSGTVPTRTVIKSLVEGKEREIE